MKELSRTREFSCRVCRRRFYPDPRAGDRQRACSLSRNQKIQAKLARGKPRLRSSYRIDQRNRSPTEERSRSESPRDSTACLGISQKTKSAAKALISLGYGIIPGRSAKDQFRTHPIDPTRVPNPLPPPAERRPARLSQLRA